MEEVLRWLPGIVAIVVVGIWGGRLERAVSDLKERIRELEKRVQNVDLYGTRVSGLLRQRVSNLEAHANNVVASIGAIEERAEQTGRDLQMVEERQRVNTQRIDSMIRFLSRQHGILANGNLLGGNNDQKN